LSFFDDDDEDEDEDELAPTTVRPASTRQQPRTAQPPRPKPRRPQRAGGPGGPSGPGGADHHAMMVRRRIAAGVGVALLIVIVLVVNGCLKRGKQQALETYNQNVSQIARTSEQQIAKSLFSTLSGASTKSALDVEVQVDQLRIQAQSLAERAQGLSVPSEMTSAQRALLMALDMREEGLAKIASLIRTALGEQGSQATSTIAGDMEIFLASDVIFSQRVVPLIEQELAAGGVSGQSTSGSRFVPNIGWLEPKTVAARITGQGSSTSGGAVQPGNHGSGLVGVSVGTNKLAASPTLNHVSGGANPTFTVMVENSGEFPETNVKVDVSVTSEGKTLSASHLIDKTEPGKTYSVDVPVNGVTLGAASRVSVNVEGVPGENDLENNKASYLAIFQ
jgi:hypothetical protein